MKIGDKVRAVSGGGHNGQEGTIVMSYISSDTAWNVMFDHGFGCEAYYESNLTLIEDKKNMNILEKFTIALKSEPEKTFRKTGITNGDDLLTEDGQKIFLSWLLKKNGETFKAEVADGLLKDVEDKNKE